MATPSSSRAATSAMSKSLEHRQMATEDNNYWELGFNLYGKEPGLLGVAVWRRADKTCPSQEEQFNFVSGYGTARRQRDDYEREQRDQADGRGNAAEAGDRQPQ